MYKVSDDTKSAYKSDASYKAIEVRIPSTQITLENEDIIADSLELKESIESGDNLSFQGCISSSFKIECFNLVDETLEGKWIECDIQADDTDVIPLFRGYISEVTNATHEEFTTVIRAYDALYTINNKDVTSWYNSLTFPISVKNMRDSFFNYVGVTQVADYLPNDALVISKTITDKVIVGATIIKAICQVNGRFGRISRDGKFEYVHLVEGTEALYPREDLYPDNDIYPSDENAIDNVSKAYYTSISFENYRVSPITKVQIIDKEGQIIATQGSGTNVFTLKDNPLVWGQNASQVSQVAINLYNTIQGLWYTPSEIECVGLPYVECGDFVLMTARRSIIRAYVLSRTLKGIQILNDAYEAPGDRTQPTYVPDIKTQANANAAAITSEVSRASIAETGLQANINNEASARASADASEAATRQSQVNAVNMRCDSLSAKDAQIENLVATKASISQLNAESASIRDLVATKASIDSLNATNANVGSLSAQVASINNLVASKATISELNAVKATVNYINSRYITAEQVTTAVNNALQGRITCGELRAGSISIYDGSGYTGLYTLLDRRYVRKN